MLGIRIKKQDVKAELQRRKSQYTRMLELLQKKGEVTNLELAKISYRYSARIGQMRKDGHVIVASYERPGVWRYTYLGSKDDD